MSSPGKDFHIDAVYPEHLSRLRRGTPKTDLSNSASYRRSVKKQLRKGNSGRFRTQPVTFHEIKEVDEENLGESEDLTQLGVSVASTSKSESDLKAKFELFYKSIIRDSVTLGFEGVDPNPNPKDAKLIAKETTAKSTDVAQGTESSSSAVLDQPLASVPFNPRSRPSL